MHRRHLLVTAGTAVTAGIAGCSSGETDETAPEEIELIARTDGWEGTEPQAIEGETNPTISLVAGEDYSLVWENGDGATHDIRIVTADGESVLQSDDSTVQGETVTVEFTTDREMAEYYCTYHPDSMRGDIRITEAGNSFL